MPYGEEANPGAIANDQIKFATYTRDSSTGLDYADQRFYTSQFGRFMSADRSHLNVGLNVPGSWNKYSYVNGDPINGYDPTGQDCQLVADGNGVFHLFCTGSSPDGGTGGGGGTDGPPVDLGTPGAGGGGSYAATTPRDAALILARGVQTRDLTDCQALAAFADFEASNESINSNFAQDFGIFVQTDRFVNFANRIGIPIASSSNAVTLLPPGSTIPSGFGTQYQEGYDSQYPDQTHHFAAFFQLGFFGGAAIGAAAARYLDSTNLAQYNPGDIALGIAASQLGADFRAGKISASQIGNDIRQTLCQHN
jgi:RHS repeat-associated protein